MKHQISEYKKKISRRILGIRQFESQIQYLTMGVKRATIQLPELYKQIEHYEKMLPIWKRDLEINQKSLKLHLTFLQKERHHYELAAKILDLNRNLRMLSKDIQKGL